jgi:hypothetical protein
MSQNKSEQFARPAPKKKINNNNNNNKKQRKKERKRQQNPFQGLINSKFKHAHKERKTHHCISDIPNIDLGILRLYCPQTRNTNSKVLRLKHQLRENLKATQKHMPTNLLRQTNSKSIIQNPKNTPIS